jgi:hypothetical protein
MGWLDANEYLLISATARDRVDDLLASTEVAIERVAITDQRTAAASGHVCDVRGCTLGHLPV